MKKTTNMTKGIMLALLTATISGVSIFYSKISVVKIDPLLLTTSRNLIVGMLFLALFLSAGKFKELVSLTKKNAFLLLMIGLIGGSLPFYLFFTGLKLIGAQQGNMIHKTLFVWVALLAFVFLKEKINMKLVISGLLIVAGTFFFTPFRLALGQGALLVLVADLLWAGETVIAKKVLAQVSPELTGLSRMFLGGIVLAAASLMSGKATALLSLSLPQWGMIGIGAALLFFYVYTWFKALSYAPASVVTLALTWSLVVGNVLNGSFNHTRLTIADWYSMALITGGVVLGTVLTHIIGKRVLTNDQAIHE